MKLARLFGLAVLLTGAFFCVFADEENEKIKYVEVKRPLPKIYAQMDPKSDIVRLAKKGEYLEILSEGESWYKVKTNDGKVGFVEAKSGDVVTKKGGGPGLIMVFIVIVFMLGGAGYVVFFLKKRQQQQNDDVDID